MSLCKTGKVWKKTFTYYSITVECVCVCVKGIQSDDCVLAAALWRNLFGRQCEDPQQLELMVEYVRKQVRLFTCSPLLQYFHFMLLSTSALL